MTHRADTQLEAQAINESTRTCMRHGTTRVKMPGPRMLAKIAFGYGLAGEPYENLVADLNNRRNRGGDYYRYLKKRSYPSVDRIARSSWESGRKQWDKARAES